MYIKYLLFHSGMCCIIRGWLPLHWAAALEHTELEDLKIIIKDRPMNAQKGKFIIGF